MLDYLTNLFISLGTLGNIALCFALFLIVAMLWSFSFGHKLWGLMTLLSLIFFTIIIHRIPAQYIWFRPVPVIFLALYIAYQVIFFFPYRKRIFEVIKAEVARRKPTLLRDNLFFRIPRRYEEIPFWILPAVVAITMAGIVGAGFVKQTNEMAAAVGSNARATTENTRAVQGFDTRLKNVERNAVELQALRASQDSLGRVIEEYQIDATTATQEARMARQKAEVLFQVNKRRIERLEREKSKPVYEPIYRRTSYEPSALADSNQYAHAHFSAAVDSTEQDFD